MPGRKSALGDQVNWQLIYEICADPRVAPGDRAEQARRRGVDRSKIQVERYFVAADLINRYHATDLINLRSVSDRVWHQLEHQLLADLEEELDSPDPDASYRERDRILGQVTRPMLERAAAGWHAWEAAQVAPQEEPAASARLSAPGPRQGWRRWRLAAGAGIGVLAVVAGLAGAVLARRPALSVSYVGLLPESYLTGGEVPPEHPFVGYRFRVEGDNLPTLSPEKLWRMIERPPDCPTTGYGFETPNSVDLFIYCTADMAPGRYRLGVVLPDRRRAHTTFAPPVPGAPRITGISPNPMKGSGDPQRLTLAGSGFRAGATVVWVNEETSSRHTVFPDSPDKWVSIRDNEIVLNVLLDEPTDGWTAQVINPDGQASNAVTLQIIPPDPPPVLQVRGVVRLTPAEITPGGSTAITAEILNADFAQAAALKLQLNIYEVPRGVASLADLVTGDDVGFLFDRAGLKGPRGLMQQAIFRLSQRVVDGRTYISFTLNLPEDAGDIDYILNAGTEAKSDMYQALLPIRPAGAETPPAEEAPTG